jgi:hypothetical protein
MKEEEDRRIAERRLKMVSREVQTVADQTEKENRILKKQVKLKEIEYDALYKFNKEKVSKDESFISNLTQ